METPDRNVCAAVADDDPRTLTVLPPDRLRWFIRLRWVFLGAAVVVLALERFVLTSARRPTPLALILGGLAAVNLAWVLVARVLCPFGKRPRGGRCALRRRGKGISMEIR